MKSISMSPHQSNLAANQRGAGKGGIPSVFHMGLARPALPDHERSARLAHMLKCMRFVLDHAQEIASARP